MNEGNPTLFKRPFDLSLVLVAGGEDIFGLFTLVDLEVARLVDIDRYGATMTFNIALDCSHVGKGAIRFIKKSVYSVGGNA
jgi:hypothetical protein